MPLNGGGDEARILDQPGGGTEWCNWALVENGIYFLDSGVGSQTFHIVVRPRPLIRTTPLPNSRQPQTLKREARDENWLLCAGDVQLATQARVGAIRSLRGIFCSSRGHYRSSRSSHLPTDSWQTRAFGSCTAIRLQRTLHSGGV